MRSIVEAEYENLFVEAEESNFFLMAVTGSNGSYEMCPQTYEQQKKLRFEKLLIYNSTLVFFTDKNRHIIFTNPRRKRDNRKISESNCVR